MSEFGTGLLSDEKHILRALLTYDDVVDAGVVMDAAGVAPALPDRERAEYVRVRLRGLLSKGLVEASGIGQFVGWRITRLGRAEVAP